jgi:predicted O-linked N-acetylglucosamine transferase (SPINDLY family)
MKLATEHWVECAGRNSAFIADRIYRDRINILVDLKGYTRGSMPEVFASRPANITMQWLGYPGSMGANFIDYIVADKTVIPDELRDAYSEKVICLPHTYQINDRQRMIKPAKSRAAYGVPENTLVLCSFNQPYKITPEIFDVWMGILRDTPHAVLWLFTTHDEAIPNLQREAKQRGIDAARLVFAKRAPQDQHLARYTYADVCLDTSPYGGHTTTSDALWAGVPVVALKGKSFAARVSASLLHAAKLDELVTDSLAEYDTKIRALISKPEEIARLKRHLMDNKKSLPLFDTPNFVKALESAYEKVWAAYQNKETLQGVDVT